MPEENLFDLPPPLTRTFVADGFYPILRADKLSPGPHTIAWVARQSGEQLPLLVYELTVGPCDPPFHRGDANTDTHVNITDAIAILESLFLGGDPFKCDDAADSDDDGDTDLTDAVFLLDHLFRSGPPPPPPGLIGCAPDPTPDSLDCGEGC